MSSEGSFNGAQVKDPVDLVTELIGHDRVAWPGGWPGEVESALIDAVFSIRARYGNSPDVGVRAVVNRWRRERGGRADDLRRLADAEPERLRSVLENDSKISQRLKAEVVHTAAGELSDAGLVCAADLVNASEESLLCFRKTYLAVRGLGPVTWSYFGMLLGRADVKADRWIMRFVEPVGIRQPDDARALLSEVAARMGVSATQLDHAIWQHMRSRRS